MRPIRHKSHIAHILTLSLVWLILSANAAASDWFVRPAGGDYGSEDGSSYQNAWDGLTNVVWGTGGVEAGDILYVCGRHLFPENPVHSADRNWNINANGTSGNRITIRGDYSGDPGIIWGNPMLCGEENPWSDEGDNVYSTITGNYSSFFFETHNGAETWADLSRADTLQDCKDTPGSYYAASWGYPSTLYVHCFDNGNPDGRIIGGVNGWHISIVGQQYITFKNIDFYMPNFSMTNFSYIRWEGCKLWYNHLVIRDGCHDIEIIDCDIAHSKGGISIQDTAPSGIDTPYNITVRGCYIHDIGVYPIKQNTDAEGIGVNGGDDLTIENNEFYNCGSAFTCYPYENQTSKNLIIRWNYIHDSHQLGGANGRGIQLNMRASNIQDKSGCQVYGNIVANTQDYAYRSTWATDQIVFYNNVAYNCGGSFYFNYTYTNYLGPNIVLRNNISINPTTFHLYFGSASNEGNYTIDSDYNLFYPDKSDGFAFKQSGYATYPNLSGWQALSRSGCTFGPNSIIADPLFVDPGNGDFSLIPGSLAIDAGIDVGLTQGFGGNPIPLGSAPDIGAYEAVIDPDNPPPVLQAIGDKSVDENAALTFTVNATDPDSEPVTYLAQDLPSGATLDSQTGDFAWTPSYTQAGSYQVRFIAHDDNSYDSEKITITVTNVNRPPVLGAISFPSVDENDLLNISVSATDLDGQALTYSVSGLPNGAVFASQTFTWTPSYDQAGTFDVTFIVDDGQDQDSQLVRITVNNPCFHCNR